MNWGGNINKRLVDYIEAMTAVQLLRKSGENGSYEISPLSRQ